MQDIVGKVAFITGGASGIGLGMAQAFGAAGMKIVIADINPDTLTEAEALLRRQDFEVASVKLDVADRSAWTDAADRAESRFGPVQLLCNNAGVGSYVAAIDLTPVEWDWVQAINVTGTFNGVHEFARRFRDHGRGSHIVNTASVAGLLTLGKISAYAAAKHAVVGYSKSLRVELAELKIGVSVLCPTAVRTNIVRSTAALRPTDVPADSAGAAMDAKLEAYLRTGTEPVEVGRMVLRAIRADRFYIFTHPELVREQIAAECAELFSAIDSA
jgi:NAD(P)-dependent dehydrogenase (short-subunit alcohol dehydrogenase family)